MGWRPDGSFNFQQLFDASWQQWQAQYPWIPVKNHRGRGDFSKAVHSNPLSRSFLENLDPVVGQQFIADLKYRGGMDHTQRLLTAFDSPTLTHFSLAYWRSLIPHNAERMEYISQALPESRDGNSATQFWAFAPYIFKRLINSQNELIPALQEGNAIDLVLNWSNSKKPYGEFDDAIYPGFYSFHLKDGFFLAHTETHPSHALARRIGTHIADQLRPLLG